MEAINHYIKAGPSRKNTTWYVLKEEAHHVRSRVGQVLYLSQLGGRRKYRCSVVLPPARFTKNTRTQCNPLKNPATLPLAKATAVFRRCRMPPLPENVRPLWVFTKNAQLGEIIDSHVMVHGLDLLRGRYILEPYDWRDLGHRGWPGPPRLARNAGVKHSLAETLSN